MKPFTTESRILQMDAGTVKNLELFESGLLKNKGSLCWTLNHTKTNFGARYIKFKYSQSLNFFLFFYYKILYRELCPCIECFAKIILTSCIQAAAKVGVSAAALPGAA